MKVQQILDLIDSGDVALPEFQRGYVWNREQVRGLFTSLYRGYPVGSLMTWNTRAEGASARGGVSTDGTLKLLLDGQQRMTSLYGVIRGRAPKFFEGNDRSFSGLFFDVVDEVFEFYAPAKMRNSPRWLDVTAIMGNIGPYLTTLLPLEAEYGVPTGMFVGRLNAVNQIPMREVHIEEVVGPDKTIDVVVDIFNRVNSGGTKLSKGDLAFAKICASWPSARQEFNDALTLWREAGYEFSLDWLLRVVNGIVTGRAQFVYLAEVSASDVRTGLRLATKYVSAWLDVIGGRLGLDHQRVLFGYFALVVLARFSHRSGGELPDSDTQSRLLYWYLHCGMWGRFAGSTETVLTQDLDTVDKLGVDGLIDTLRRWRGDLTVRESDLAGSTMGSRFYPTLYMLTRTQAARDFGTGLPLSASLLGMHSSLDVHHIFPKAVLYRAGFDRSEVNAVANFCFLTKHTNIRISDRQPSEYMPEVELHQAGALSSQWIPIDIELWTTDRFREFLAARRELLAASLNNVLDSLLAGGKAMAEPMARAAAPETDDLAPVRLAESMDELTGWLQERGFSAPQRDVEVAHPGSGAYICTAEGFWPAGLQEGIGSPVVLELDELDAESALAALGYRVFTTIDALKRFAQLILAEE